MFSNLLSDSIDSSDLYAHLTQYFGYLTFFSVITFLLSIILIPLIVRKLPATYFIDVISPNNHRNKLSTIALVFLLLRNTLGLVLLLAGIAMLFLPGQGVLTILLAILLLSLPGKKRIITSLISRPNVRKSLNWLRSQSSTAPFVWPNDD